MELVKPEEIWRDAPFRAECGTCPMRQVLKLSLIIFACISKSAVRDAARGVINLRTYLLCGI